MIVDDFALYRYRATLLRVVDGDTIRVSLDLGLRIARDVPLRIAGVDAPEINAGTDEARRRGLAARDWLGNFLGWSGQPLCVRTYKDRQSFDRYLADVWALKSGELVDVADALVGSGHATRSGPARDGVP